MEKKSTKRDESKNCEEEREKTEKSWTTVNVKSDRDKEQMAQMHTGNNCVAQNYVCVCVTSFAMWNCISRRNLFSLQSIYTSSKCRNKEKDGEEEGQNEQCLTCFFRSLYRYSLLSFLSWTLLPLKYTYFVDWWFHLDTAHTTQFGRFVKCELLQLRAIAACRRFT